MMVAIHNVKLKIYMNALISRQIANSNVEIL